MKVNYIVNYGVNARHMFETETFEYYCDANTFYLELDREKWGAANIVKIEDGPEGPYGPAKVTEKKSYCVR